MRVLLVLNKSYSKDFRILVRLHTKSLEDKVKQLLHSSKDKEAFNLMKTRAQVDTFISSKARLDQRPELTLFEDML